MRFNNFGKIRRSFKLGKQFLNEFCPVPVLEAYVGIAWLLAENFFDTAISLDELFLLRRYVSDDFENEVIMLIQAQVKNRFVMSNAVSEVFHFCQNLSGFSSAGDMWKRVAERGAPEFFLIVAC